MSEVKVWALILDGKVENTVLAYDEDIKDPKYIWIDITGMSPRPFFGWKHDGVNFIIPEGF